MSYQVHNSRRIPPRGPPPRKRKERDDGWEQQHQQQVGSTTTAQPPRRSTMRPDVSSNHLLAGYMAYEYITRGTLLGQEFCSAEPRSLIAAGADEPGAAQQGCYAEVATLLKTEGAHIPGIVNPTQLALWIQK